MLTKLRFTVLVRLATAKTSVLLVLLSSWISIKIDFKLVTQSE